ncbi:MAG TPA: hypothetical protein VKF62_12580 [Planctomycetota bacterium]|nr:hypothetical protein [Planctomycetota bacterium]
MNLPSSFPILALLALLPSDPPRSRGEVDVQALFPDAKETRPIEAKLSEADRAAVARAVGRDPAAPAPAIEMYRTRASVEEEPKDLRVAIVSASGAGGEFRVALAVDPAGDLQAAKVIGEAGAAGSEKFLSQFLGPFPTAHATGATAMPLSVLEEKRSASKGDGPDAKKLRTLFALLDLMRDNQASSDALETAIEGRDWAGSAPHARRLSENLARLASIGPDLPPLLEGKEVETFLQLAEGARKAAGDLAEALEKGEGKRAADLSTSLQQACARCHGWDAHRHKRPLMNAFERVREEAGIGTGHFVVGHDVTPAAGAEDASQAVAFAIKEGLLLLRKAP